MNMAESKKFQSGREIFEEFIPDYKTDDTELEDVSSQTDRFVEAILCDFNTRVPKSTRASASSSK